MKYLLFIGLLCCSSFSRDTTINLKSLPVHGELWIDSRTAHIRNDFGLDSINFDDQLAIKRDTLMDLTLGSFQTHRSMLIFSGSGIEKLGHKFIADMDTVNKYNQYYNKSDTIWNQSLNFPDSIHTMDSLGPPFSYYKSGIGICYSEDHYDRSTNFHGSILLDSYSSIVYARLKGNIIIKMQLTDTMAYNYPRGYQGGGWFDSTDMLSDVKLVFTIAEGDRFPIMTNNVREDEFIRKSNKKNDQKNLRNIKKVYAFDASGRLVTRADITDQNTSLNELLHKYKRFPQNILFLKIITDRESRFIKVNNLHFHK